MMLLRAILDPIIGIYIFINTGKPPHGCRNQIAPRLPDKCVLWTSWDEFNNVDIDIGVDDDVAADDCFEHLLD